MDGNDIGFNTTGGGVLDLVLALARHCASYLSAGPPGRVVP